MYEHLFLSKVLQTGSVDAALKIGTKTESFPRLGHVWQWITNFYSEHGTCPDPKTLQNFFPEFPYEDAPEPLEFYYKELIWEADNHSFVQYVSSLNDLIKENDREGAKALTSKLYRDVVCRESLISDLDSKIEFANVPNTLDKLAEFFKNCIPTGIPRADAEFGGWGPGEFIPVLAPTYTGKTWFLINSVVAALRAGKRPLFISGEMTRDRAWYRFLAYWFGLPAKRMLQGLLTNEEKERVKSLPVPDESLFIAPPSDANGGGVELIKRKVYQYAPDIVFVDNLKALVREGNNPLWERLGALARDTKVLALETNIPIVITQHLSRGKGKKGGELEDVAGSMEFSNWGDIVVILALNDELRKTNSLGVIFRKVRDFDPFSCVLKFAVNEGEPMAQTQDKWILENSKKQVVEEKESDDINGFF